MNKATFGGGCFWCMVQPFDSLAGIHSVTSGYMGGLAKSATYEFVKTGTTGHYEVVQIVYDEAIFPYEKLLEIYWMQVDPTDKEGQFHDRGSQYAPVIFVHNEHQRTLAERSKQAMENSKRFKKPIVVEIKDATVFYEAEEYHQDYYKKSPKHYKEDRLASKRDDFIKTFWTEELEETTNGKI